MIVYKEYIQSKEWKRRRKNKLASVGYKCEWCNEKSKLSVHHKHYKTLGNESTGDLIVLCASCHWVADRTRESKDTSLLNTYNKKRQKTKAEIKKDKHLHPKFGEYKDKDRYGSSTKKTDRRIK